jgi:hypothetical protein
MLILETPKTDSTFCNISKSKTYLETKEAILFFIFFFTLILIFIFKMSIVSKMIGDKKKRKEGWDIIPNKIASK